MNFSALFIRRPIMTILLTVALILAGIIAFEKLPVSELPDVDYPVIVIQVAYPGATPDTMANVIAAPLEKECIGISGLKQMTSSNYFGDTSVFLQFEVSKSLDAAAVDVQAAIMRAKTHLPADLPHDPIYWKVNPAAVPIMYLLLSSTTLPLWELFTYADTFVGQHLANLDGVAQVDITGSPYAIRLQVDPSRLAGLDLTLEEVANAVQKENVRIPSGRLDGSHVSPIITVDGQLEQAALYDRLIIAYKDQMPVRIQDVGRAIDSIADLKDVQGYTHGGQDAPTVIISVQRQPGSNTLEIAKAIHDRLPEIKASLPASTELVVFFDRANSIQASIEEAQWTLFFAFLLVALVVFVYMGKITYAIIPIVIMPLSLLGTFPIMYMLHYTIDNLSVLAFILAMGFIIDDAIVVLEDIVRRIETGQSVRSATIRGAYRIGFTIISMTFSLVATFIPLVLMEGLIGKIFQEFAVTLITITLISGVISLTITPMLCSLLLKNSLAQGAPTRMERVARSVNNWLLRLYNPALRWILDRGIFALLTIPITLGCIVYFLASIPVDFLPNDNVGFLIGYTQGEDGISSSQMFEHQKKLLHILQEDPQVESIGWAAPYHHYHEGVIYIRLTPEATKIPTSQIIEGLSKKLDLVPGINTRLKGVPSIDLSLGAPSKGSYQYTLQSSDPSLLYRTTERMIAKMSELPDLQGISSDLLLKGIRLNIEILRDQAAALGISAEAIERTLKWAYAGVKVSSFDNAINQYDVILELEPRFQGEASSLDLLFIRSSISHELVPLSAVARWKEEAGATTLPHVGRLPAATISFSLVQGAPAGEALAAVSRAAEEILPSGVKGSLQGTGEAIQQAMRNIPWLFGMALMAIYIALGMLYESFIHPLTVLSTLPSAIFGGLATLAVIGAPISLYAALGLFMLIGIVKKNGIMIIDYAIGYERSLQKTAKQAIFDACLLRFRPIRMTTVAAVMGALPLVLATGVGAEARRPLGYVVIGGLLMAQLITLFVTPVCYLYMARWHARFSLRPLYARRQPR